MRSPEKCAPLSRVSESSRMHRMRAAPRVEASAKPLHLLVTNRFLRLSILPRQAERLSARLWPRARNRCGVIAKCCRSPMVLSRFHSARAGHRYSGREIWSRGGAIRASGLKTNRKIRRRVSKPAAWLLPYRWRNISDATKLAVPSAGNAGGALAAYAARAGLEAHIFMPRDTPRANIIECRELGAQVTSHRRS